MEPQYQYSLQQDFENGKIPIVNGIIYPDGIVDLIEININEHGRRELVKGNRTHISEIFTNKDHILYSSFGDEEPAFSVPINGYAVACGEGSWGGDGFVALKSIENELVWIAFSDESNPFVKAEILDGFIYATNNLYEIWRFDISNPSDVCVVKQSPFIK